jgi:cell division protein FtsI (penicillin-binding protein 3)
MKWFRRIMRRVTVREKSQPVPGAPGETAPAKITKSIYVRAASNASPERQLGRMRVVGLAVGMVFCLVAFRTVSLVVLDDPAAHNDQQTLTANLGRGQIRDRDGDLLATTLDFYTVYIDPHYVWDDEELITKLSTVLPNINQNRLRSRLQSNTRYIEIESNVPPRVRQAIHLLGLPGVFFKTRPGRVYPRQRAASHLVGYADRDMQGLSGSERAFDAELGEGDDASIYLSIDLTAQHRVESILRERIAHYQAEGGLAILMRVGTGEIVAMASLPDFDPNRMGQSLGDFDSEFNQAIHGRYELGSVFKPLSLGAGMQAGLISLNDIFDATHPIRIGRHQINDHHGQRRPLTAREVILYSSNIGSARIADQIGETVLRDFYRDLRLMEPAPIELPGSREPNFPRQFGRLGTMTAAYGHGFEVSPLALTAAYAAMANDGVYVPPTMRALIPGEVVSGTPAIDPTIARQILAVMRENIVRSQTGSADVEGMAVAGKTGTAERVVNGAYVEGNLFTSFIGIFPFDDPQYVLMVSIDRPKPAEDTHGFNTAGWNAMPTAGAMIRDLASVLELERRAIDNRSQVSTVRALFSPRPRVRLTSEEPIPLAQTGAVSDGDQ